MRIDRALTMLFAGIFAVTISARPSDAQYAASSYPYCALSSASGATTCYFRSRAECGGNCISNPWYVGAAGQWGDNPARPRKPR